MRCPNCNFEINKEDIYCSNCGAEISPLKNQIKNSWKDSRQRKGIKSFVRKNTLKKLICANIFIILSIFLVYVIDYVLLEYLKLENITYILVILTIILTFSFYIFGTIGIFALALDISRKKEFKILDIYKKSFKVSHKMLIVLLLAIYIIFRVSISVMFILPISVIFKLALIVCFILVLPIFTTTIIKLMDSNISKEDKKISILWNESIDLIKGHRIEYYGLLLSFAPYIILYFLASFVLIATVIINNIYLLIISFLLLALLYIVFIPYIIGSLVNLYREWLGEETFDYKKQGLNNGSIIITVSSIILIIIIFTSMLIPWLPKSKLGDQILYYIENFEYDLKAKEFTIGEGKNIVTFNIPKGYKLTKDSTSTSVDIENEDYINYRYQDNSYTKIEEYYQNDIEYEKEKMKDSCQYDYEEFTLSINNKEIKAFSVEEKCENTTLDYNYTARIYYPINNKSSIEIWIDNYDKPYKQEELKKFLNIKS